jgi:SAM-dependent methyltransferase
MFDARAAHYDDGVMHRWLAETAVSTISVPDHAVVVDVAAGTGLAGRAVRHRQPSVQVLAVDLAAELLRVARAHGLSPVQGDAERLPVGSQTVDAVLCVSAAAYFHHPQRALQEFARVLRPGGTCLVQTWCDGTISPTRILRQSAASAGIDIPDPNSALGRESRLRQAMSAAGLTVVTIHERAWHASWPDPDAAWSNAIQGLLGGPLSGLDSSRLARVETAFTSQLRALSTRHADDAQRLLIGVGIVG